MGGRSGAEEKNFPNNQKNYFQFYFQQMQWKPAKSGNNAKTGWKARKGPRNYRNSKLNKRYF